jgi:hypothetical protein
LAIPDIEPRDSHDIAVVVAAVESERSIQRCLEALDHAIHGKSADVIVVGASDDTRLQASIGNRSRIRFLSVPPRSLTPRMWSEGIAQSNAPLVALTTGHCFLVPEWVESMIAALTRENAAAAGGPMRLARDAGAVDAAIFFLRYSSYIQGHPRSVVTDIAGDNAVYVRERIPADTWSREDGFWELTVNRRLREQGNSIVWADDAVAEFGASFSFRSICHHRFEHGRLFGTDRVKRGESRLRIVAGFPAVPFALALRAWSRVSRNGSYGWRFMSALPLMIAIGACWAFGEAVGALEAVNADRG